MAQPPTTDSSEPILVMSRARGASISEAAVSADATISETHTSTNTITDHPVEEGGNVSDHSRPEADRLQVELVISDTPLSTVQMQRAQKFMQQAGLGTLQGNQQIAAIPGYARAAYDRLQQYRTQGALLTVVTSLKTYTSMEIESIVAPRDAKTHDAVRCTITFKFVRVVQNKLTRRVVAKDPRVGSKVKTGNQTPKQDAVEQSQLDKGYEAAKGKSGVNAVGAFVGGVFGGGG